MQTQLIVNHSYRLELIGEDIISVDISDRIDYIQAVQLVEERKRMAEGRDMKVMICVGSLKMVEQEAQTYFASAEAEEGIYAGAIVKANTSMVVRTVINTFLNMRNGKSPAKVFNEREEAIEWLRSL